MNTFLLRRHSASAKSLTNSVTEFFFSMLTVELEDEAKAINWWFIPGQKQSSRLFALWNRTAGDCLLDSVLQVSAW